MTSIRLLNSFLYVWMICLIFQLSNYHLVYAADHEEEPIVINNSTSEQESNGNVTSSTTPKPQIITTTISTNTASSILPIQCGMYSNISGSIHQQRNHQPRQSHHHHHHRRRRPRILGGQDALIEEFPWHGSLQKLRIILPLPIPDWRHICGASVINEYWLLTAAHCVDGLINSIFPGQLRVVLGTDRWRYTLFQRNIQMLPVSKILIHPQWNSRRAQNDIALIKTTKAIKFNEKVRPICLPDVEDYEVPGGQNVTVAGYGYTTDNLIFNFLPDKLKAVRVPVIRMDNCRQTYNISRIPITDKMICAGITTYGRCSGAMRGDSGSALITYQNGRAIHTGIVSFSLPCRVFGAPDVYTKTSSYLEWIHATIKSH